MKNVTLTVVVEPLCDVGPQSQSLWVFPRYMLGRSLLGLDGHRAEEILG